MTNTANEKIVRFSIGEMVAAIPHLMSFTPRNSLVIMWLDANSRLIVTQRADLPSDIYSPSALSEWGEATFQHEAAKEAYAGVLVVVPPPPHQSTVPTDEIIAAILAGVSPEKVAATVVTDFATWRYASETASHAITAADMQNASATLGLGLSHRPLGSREAVEAEFAPAENPVSKRMLANARRRRDQVEQASSLHEWNDTVMETAVTRLLNGQNLTDRQLAELLVFLDNTEGRDTILSELPSAAVAAPVVSFVSLVPRTPVGKRAPIATVTAIYAYLHGDGLRANIALDIAQADNPEYSLATIIATVIQNGLSPRSVREMLQKAQQRL